MSLATTIKNVDGSVKTVDTTGLHQALGAIEDQFVRAKEGLVPEVSEVRIRCFPEGSG